MVLRGVNTPPASHTQNVDDTGQAVEDIPPAAEQPHIFAGEPPTTGSTAGTDALNGRLKVAGHSDQNVNGHNDKGEHLEPLGLADAPLVLKHHKANAPCGGSIQLGIMEPAVHVDHRIVINRPVNTLCGRHIDDDKVHAQCSRKHQEKENAACLGAAGDFVSQHQPGEDQCPAQQLPQRSIAVDLE